MTAPAQQAPGRPVPAPMVLSLLSCGAVLWAQVAKGAPIVDGREMEYEGVLAWVLVAAVLGVGPFVAARRPERWGLVCGACLFGAMAIIQRWAPYADALVLPSFGSLLRDGPLVAVLLLTAILAGTHRPRGLTWSSPVARSGLVVAASVCGLAVLLPAEGAGWLAWLGLKDLGLGTLVWWACVLVLVAVPIVTVRTRSVFGRWVTLGVAGVALGAGLSGLLVDSRSWLAVPLGLDRPLPVLALAATVVAALVRSVVTVTPVSGGVNAGEVDAPVAAGVVRDAADVGGAAAMEPASVGARFGAFLLESLVWGVLGVGFFVVTNAIFLSILATSDSRGRNETIPPGAFLIAPAASLVLVVVLVAVQCRRIGRTGQWWPQRAVGIRIVDATTGQPIGAGRAFVRTMVRSLGIALGYVGPLVALFNARRRALHDLAAGSMVVVARSAPAPLLPPPQPLLPPPAPVPEPVLPPQPDSSAPAPAAPAVAAVAAVGPSEPIDATVRRVPAGVRWVVLLDSGQRVPLAGVLLIGRDPAVGPADGAVQALAIDDPSRSVSKTHLALGVEAGHVWVEDRNSTNGVVVEQSTGVESVVPGVRTVVIDGAVVRFGDRSLRVVPG